MKMVKITHKIGNFSGLAQIPILIGLVIMAVAIPIATNLVQKVQENRSKAAVDCSGDGIMKKRDLTCGCASLYGKFPDNSLCASGICEERRIDTGVGVGFHFVGCVQYPASLCGGSAGLKCDSAGKKAISCDRDGYPTNVQDCPNGCKDGKCIPGKKSCTYGSASYPDGTTWCISNTQVFYCNDGQREFVSAGCGVDKVCDTAKSECVAGGGQEDQTEKKTDDGSKVTTDCGSHKNNTVWCENGTPYKCEDNAKSKIDSKNTLCDSNSWVGKDDACGKEKTGAKCITSSTCEGGDFVTGKCLSATMFLDGKCCVSKVEEKATGETCCPNGQPQCDMGSGLERICAVSAPVGTCAQVYGVVAGNLSCLGNKKCYYGQKSITIACEANSSLGLSASSGLQCGTSGGNPIGPPLSKDVRYECKCHGIGQVGAIGDFKILGWTSLGKCDNGCKDGKCIAQETKESPLPGVEDSKKETIKTCSGGTPYGECASSPGAAGWYCNNGTSEFNCEKCGSKCSADTTCDQNQKKCVVKAEEAKYTITISSNKKYRECETIDAKDCLYATCYESKDACIKELRKITCPRSEFNSSYEGGAVEDTTECKNVGDAFYYQCKGIQWNKVDCPSGKFCSGGVCVSSSVLKSCCPGDELSCQVGAGGEWRACITQENQKNTAIMKDYEVVSGSLSCNNGGACYKLTAIVTQNCTPCTDTTLTKGRGLGNFDCKGVVDVQDFLDWKAEYIIGDQKNKKEVKSNWKGDADCNGVVNLTDLDIWLRNRSL